MSEIKTAPKIEIRGMLPFGQGNVGEKLNSEQLLSFEEAIQRNILPITDNSTAQCIDGRATESKSDGTDITDIDNEILSQGPGGLALHLANALVISRAIITKDAVNFNGAYEEVRDLIESLGYKPSKHEGCLAAQKVEDTYRSSLSAEEMYSIISGIIPTTEEDLKIIEELHQNQLSLQSEGFFSSWNPDEVKNYVKEKHPHNHSILVSDHTETHGHRENALVIIQEKGYGFAKNKFIKETDGMQAFAYTSPIYEELADKIASSPEESRKIKLALWVNLISVANVIIKPDQLAVFM